MKMNFLILALASLIPVVLHYIWYNPKLLGNAWKKTKNGAEQEKMASNDFLQFVVGLVLSYMLAISMSMMVIHQYALDSIVMGPELQDPASETSIWLKEALAKYGKNYRTFKHGAFHGALTALFFLLPVLGMTALFERKSFRQVAIQVGFWIVALSLMGGIICQFA